MGLWLTAVSLPALLCGFLLGVASTATFEFFFVPGAKAWACTGAEVLQVAYATTGQALAVDEAAGGGRIPGAETEHISAQGGALGLASSDNKTSGVDTRARRKSGYYIKQLLSAFGKEISFEDLRPLSRWLRTQFQLLDEDADGMLEPPELSDIMRFNQKIGLLQPGHTNKASSNREMTFREFVARLKQLEMEQLEMATARNAPMESLQEDGIIMEGVSRATLLLGLMILQSGSAMVLARYEVLLKEHLVVMLFLTMLVGAGGNVGNQSVIKVIEQILSGKLQLSLEACIKTLWQQFTVGCFLAIILGFGGFLRALASQYSWKSSDFQKAQALRGSLAVTAALMVIVLTSAVLGTMMPLAFAALGLDVKHAGPSIQVAMDIGGVIITCSTARLILAPKRPKRESVPVRL